MRWANEKIFIGQIKSFCWPFQSDARTVRPKQQSVSSLCSGQDLKEFTLTGECKMVQELLVRLEYGRDWSHHSFFDLGNTRDIQQLGHTDVGSPWHSLAPRELYLRGTRDCSTLLELETGGLQWELIPRRR